MSLILTSMEKELAQPLLPCPSPCVRHCGIDESLRCSGCLRTGREVGAWLKMSDEERWNLLDELAKRHKAELLKS